MQASGRRFDPVRLHHPSLAKRAKDVLRSLGEGGLVLPRASFGWLTPSISFGSKVARRRNKFVAARECAGGFYDIVNEGSSVRLVRRRLRRRMD